LGELSEGDWVNLERALKAGARLGGHLVTGHVDGIGEVTHLMPDGEMTRVTIVVPQGLAHYVARKGSLTVDGVSLTVNDVKEAHVDLLLIPHTQAVTTLDGLAVGRRVNLEVDLVARYVERLMSARKDD
jgi:riboflavin synthase